MGTVIASEAKQSRTLTAKEGLDCFGARAPRNDDPETARLRVLAACFARVVHHSHTLDIKEGAGKAGRSPRPWPASNKKSWRQLPQVRPRNPAFPARWF
jgi:hypothetical protein